MGDRRPSYTPVLPIQIPDTVRSRSKDIQSGDQELQRFSSVEKRQAFSKVIELIGSSLIWRFLFFISIYHLPSVNILANSDPRSPGGGRNKQISKYPKTRKK